MMKGFSSRIVQRKQDREICTFARNEYHSMVLSDVVMVYPVFGWQCPKSWLGRESQFDLARTDLHHNNGRSPCIVLPNSAELRYNCMSVDMSFAALPRCAPRLPTAAVFAKQNALHTPGIRGMSSTSGQQDWSANQHMKLETPANSNIA